jgi:hypothetical protein
MLIRICDTQASKSYLRFATGASNYEGAQCEPALHRGLVLQSSAAISRYYYRDKVHRTKLYQYMPH